MGSLDHIHQNSFERFKDKIRLIKECQSCNKQTVEHYFTTYHNDADQLMVNIKLHCKNCDWSKTVDLFYNNIVANTSI
jgi:uncharacterized protein Yka (UPF0111/DUF47 family)